MRKPWMMKIIEKFKMVWIFLDIFDLKEFWKLNFINLINLLSTS